MPALQKFAYRAYSADGVRTVRTLQAASLDDAKRVLWNEGFRIVDIRPRRLRLPSMHQLFPSFMRVRKSQVILLTRQLATFVKVGVPMLEAFAVLHEQATSGELRAALRDMMMDLGQGRPLSAAMNQHPRIFNRLYVDMVRAAEVSGELDEVLSQIASYMTREDSAVRRIRSALIYPVIVLSLSVLVVGVLVAVVLPAFVHLFGEFGAQLPLPTRILLAVGTFFEQHRFEVLGAMAAAFVAGVIFFRTAAGRRTKDRYIVALPYLGRIVHYSIIERFLRTFATMTRAGIPVTQMFDTVILATGNLIFQERLRTVRDLMIAGQGFSEPLRQTGLFPSLVIQMIRVGEETGTLDNNLEEAATYFATEIDFRTKAMIAVMEPGLVIFVGLVVGFVAISVIAPMYGLIRAVK
jgi:type IV pilus assembly protein PilC